MLKTIRLGANQIQIKEVRLWEENVVSVIRNTIHGRITHGQ
jgi:hypothetical protein